MKADVIGACEELSHEVLDLGAHKFEPSDDYPDYARYIGQTLQHNQVERGILLSRNGVGSCVAMSKHKGVRAGVCHDPYSLKEGIEHANINVLCLGVGIIGPDLAIELVKVFLNARFRGEERHKRRLEKILAIEAAN